MKDVDIKGFLQSLAQYDFELKIAGISAVIALLLLWLIYALGKKSRPSVEENIQKELPKVKATETPKPVVRQDTATPGKPADIAGIPEELPAAKATEVAKPPVSQAPVPTGRPLVSNVIQKVSPTVVSTKTSHKIPQESVLRRHYLTHLRYMIETVSSPRPTESVLRRHHEQLIASQLDDCLKDEAILERLIKRYDEHNKIVVTPIAA
ncbi:hypothetical protein MTYM_00464 [Methylococcales bacterium]|nr:hypothetical protein MTYM_00464 [Methylococcales bacterium]